MQFFPRHATHVLIIAAIAMMPAGAYAARSDWADAGNAQLRLIATRSPDGKILGGVEINLSPGWHTYWRNPGDTGVPPRFDFLRSENLAAAEVRFPTPERLDEGTGVSAIYTDQVVFPIMVTPKDSGSPVTLRLAASFGVCGEVCIPAQTQVELTIPPVPDDDPLARATLQAADQRLPGQPSPGRFAINKVTRESDDTLAIAVRMPVSSDASLFVDGPAGWTLGQPRFVSRSGELWLYRLLLLGRPNGAPVSGQSLDFVAVSGSQAIEQTVQVP